MLKKFFFAFERHPSQEHNWIGTASWRYWGRRMVTMHVVRYRDTQYSIAFWVGYIGECWPKKGESNKGKVTWNEIQ